MASTRPNQTISNFKTAMTGGGARPNLFEVEITTLPSGIAWDAADLNLCVRQHNFQDKL
jgi:hypothetical protein